MRFCLLLLFSFLFIQKNYAQRNSKKPLLLQFSPLYAGEKLILDSTADFVYKDNPILFEAFKCYISNLCFLSKGKIVWKLKNDFYLLDASNSKSLNIAVQISKHITYDSLVFDLGIDSATNCSGALGGDLSPLKGMYWTWQSGYINFKLEGSSPLSKEKKQTFAYHLGGYLSPYPTVQTVHLPASPNKSIAINIELSDFLNKIDLEALPVVMSPGMEAHILSKKATAIFSIKHEK